MDIEPLKITIFDGLTGETIVRDLTPEEIAALTEVSDVVED
jgi:hypothetical protein